MCGWVGELVCARGCAFICTGLYYPQLPYRAFTWLYKMFMWSCRILDLLDTELFSTASDFFQSFLSVFQNCERCQFFSWCESLLFINSKQSFALAVTDHIFTESFSCGLHIPPIPSSYQNHCLVALLVHKPTVFNNPLLTIEAAAVVSLHATSYSTTVPMAIGTVGRKPYLLPFILTAMIPADLPVFSPISHGFIHIHTWQNLMKPNDSHQTLFYSE